ncbi:hypothetical protein [Candidatus Photodesmus katoptron]|uniref:hypothetical protein n=1 Tax=Candidatus Photodesmus anomalopis TaxID=28176 RepID=UPI0012DE62BF|nr:hypothetical protein [Candidatus Photodesmus katoptron]
MVLFKLKNKWNLVENITKHTYTDKVTSTIDKFFNPIFLLNWIDKRMSFSLKK